MKIITKGISGKQQQLPRHPFCVTLVKLLMEASTNEAG